MNTTTLETGRILTEGKSTFVLEGQGRRFVFQVERVDSGDRPPIHFVNLLTGSGGTYLGVYKPEEGWLRLTGASRLKEDSEPVRAFRWFAGLVWSGRESEIESNGFRFVWFAGENRE